MGKRGKRAAAHIEMILSFLLFIGVVFFAFYFFNPVSNTRTLESSLDYAISEISSNASTSLDIYSVKLNATNNVAGVETGIAKPARVESYLGKKLKSSRFGGRIYFDRDGNDFVEIIFSDDFEEENELNAPFPSIDSSSYLISSASSREVLSEKKLLALKEIYGSDYNTLKKELNLPSRIDFAFEVVFNENDTIKAEIQQPSNANIFADSKRIEFVRKDGSLAFADLIVKVW